MSDKHSKKSHNPSIKRFLLGKSAKIALGPLGLQAEPDAKSEDDQSLGPLRAEFCERGSGAQGPPVPETSVSAVAIGDIDIRNRPQTGDIADSTVEGEPGMALIAPEQDRWDPGLRPSVVLTEVSEETANGFGPLTALLRAIFVYANREELNDIRNKVEVLLPHVTSLDELFATPPGDVGELRRRDKLIIKVEDIEGRLRLSFEPSMLQRLGDPTQDDRMFSGISKIYKKRSSSIRLVHDLNFFLALTRQQMVRRTTIDDQGYNSIDPGQSILFHFRIYNSNLLRLFILAAEAAVLSNFRCAKRSEHRHGDRNGCLKYWLNGLAGTGKTTIAQTISERIFADGRLGASFFCSRDFEDRSNLKFIFPTLALQLARRYPEFRSIFVPLVRSDSEIADESLYGQMNKLIIQPLMKSSISTVIVIDALDECEDEEPVSAILSVLGQFVSQIPEVRFLVTGRPEPRIREGFRLRLLAEATDVFVLHDVELNQVYSDIRLFFRYKFSELKGRRRELEGWPTEEQLDLLCERAQGLFVHAMATVRFIDQRNGNPRKQLDRLLRSPEGSVLEGKTKFRTNATLDSLYASILQEAFGDDDPEDDHRVRSVLGAVVLSTNPLAPSTIATLLDLDAEDIFPLLLSVHSLLILQEDIDRPVRPFHKSFPDFIVDPVRCPNPRFRICPADQHTELLVGCLELMNQRLKQNIFGLPDRVSNSEVEDLKERAEQHIDQALQYSCRSWHKHLRVDVTPAQALKIIPVLHRFLQKKFLFWLEVLSILGVARVAVDALEATVKLLDESPTLNIVRDYLRFVITFIEVIDASASHIYHSALPLSPRTSIVRELYKQYARPQASVVRGLPVSWEPAIATVYHGDPVGAAAWSPDNKLFALARPKLIEILDTVTLERLMVFKYFQFCGYPRQLCFSPDSRLLTGFCDKTLSIWDLQTGGLVGTGPPEKFVHRGLGLSPTYSMDGKLLVVASTKSTKSTDFTIAAYDLLLRTRISSYRVSEGRAVTPIWTHGEYFRFATVKPGSITIWEVGFAPYIHQHKSSLYRPWTKLPMQMHICSILLSPESRSPSEGQFQSAKFVLNFVSKRLSRDMSFSSDGRFFAYLNLDQELHIWKASPASYVLHQKPVYAMDRFTKAFLSPNGESIITANQSAIHLWHTIDSGLPFSDVPTQANHRTNFILEFSSDLTLVAVVRLKGKMVEILDLKSGDPQLTIDAGMEVLCVRVTGSTVVIAGGEKVVTWNLPTTDCALDARGNIHNCVQTTIIDRSEWSPTQLEPHDLTSISPDLSCVAAVNSDRSPSLSIYDRSTGKCLALTPLSSTLMTSKPLFTPDGSEVWVLDYFVRGWKIVKDRESGVTKLDSLSATVCPFEIIHWRSSHGYEVTHDGWVLSPTQERLLWLPRHWRSDEMSRKWSGRFLELRHSELSEVVILEFPE